MTSTKHCTIGDCSGAYVARGMCRMHYSRWYDHGDPEVLLTRPRGLGADETLRHVGWDVDGECWINRVGGEANPYGYVKFEGKSQPVSRLAYTTWKGAIPDGYFICHTCDRPRCINPDHLFLGTHEENMADMVSKGRHTPGERNGMSRLTEEKVRSVRARATVGDTHDAIAAEYSIARQTVTKVVTRRSWKHVP